MSKRFSIGSKTVSSDTSVDSPSCTPTKPAKNARSESFNESWVAEFHHHIREGDKPGYAFCIPCNSDIKYDGPGKSAIRIHCNRRKHEQNVELIKNTSVEKIVAQNKDSVTDPEKIKKLEGLHH